MPISILNLSCLLLLRLRVSPDFFLFCISHFVCIRSTNSINCIHYSLEIDAKHLFKVPSRLLILLTKRCTHSHNMRSLLVSIVLIAFFTFEIDCLIEFQLNFGHHDICACFINNLILPEYFASV